MSVVQTFSVYGERLGFADRVPVCVHAEMQVPYSYTFVCQTCGEVWAKAFIREQVYLPLRTPCPQHPGSWLLDGPPGSMWLDWDKAFTDSFSDAVVRREFLLHLEHAEKEMQNESQASHYQQSDSRLE